MVAQATLLLFGSFFVMLLAGVPISAGIGIASIFTALFSMDPAIFALTAAQRCFSGIDSFSLLALPFFSLGGNIMNKGGIAKRLVRLARLAVGKMPGYLAATNVLANMFFGAVSGSSVAATSAMGSIMAPLELDEGYDPNYSAAVNICSAPTGILIPPSGPLILYSITAGGVSVAALFMGGYLPGILMGLCVAGLAVFIAVKKGYKSSDVKDPDPAIKVIIDAVPSLPADHPLWAEELGVTALRGMAAFPRKPNGGPIPADCCKTEGRKYNFCRKRGKKTVNRLRNVKEMCILSLGSSEKRRKSSDEREEVFT